MTLMLRAINYHLSLCCWLTGTSVCDRASSEITFSSLFFFYLDIEHLFLYVGLIEKKEVSVATRMKDNRKFIKFRSLGKYVHQTTKWKCLLGREYR